MLNFKEWLKNENMWGNTPCRTRKPSDGWVGKQSYSSNGSGEKEYEEITKKRTS